MAKRRGIAKNKKKQGLGSTTQRSASNQPAQSQLKTLLAHYQEGRHSEAELAARALTQQHPQHPFAWKVLGAVLLDGGRAGEALLATQRSAELSPLDPDTHLNLGAVLKELGALNEAEESCRQAIRLNAQNASAYHNLGMTLHALNRLGEAEASYREALALRPEDASTHFRLGITLQDSSRYEDAALAHRAAILAKPDFVEAHYNLGVVNQDLGRLDDAARNYKRATELNPGYAEAHNNLGIVFQDLGRFKEAELSYRAALAVQPHYPQCHINLGVLFRQQGVFKEATQHCLKAIAQMPAFSEAHRHLATMKTFATKDEQFSQMERIYKTENIPEYERCQISFALAKAHEDMEEYEHAFRFYLEANRLRKKLLGYDFSQDKVLFERVRSAQPSVKQASLPRGLPADQVSPIFLIGMARSGMTLVEQIISSHSQVAGAGELSLAAKLGFDMVAGNCLVGLDQLATFKQNYLRGLVAGSSGEFFVSDKTPDNFLYLGLIAAAFPEAKIIHVWRNPAAVCWANFKQYFSGSALAYSYSIDDIIKYYRNYADLMSLWRDELGGRIYDLDYEELTSNPNAEIRALIDYLELAWEDACLAPEQNARSVATASNIQVRQGIYTGSSQNWKHYRPYLKGAFDSL
ncbi:MAG: tetratricopeptide repeat protein [Luminiphilus sp.]|nr:tetratricopeptide repeat protein [Luminiphilus sp.]